jgi:hypothetical protein
VLLAFGLIVAACGADGDSGRVAIVRVATDLGTRAGAASDARGDAGADPDATGAELRDAAPADAAPPTAPAVQPPEPPADACEQFHCPSAHGLAQMCVPGPGEAGSAAPRCVPDMRGRAYMATDFRLAGLLRDVPEAALAEEVISSVLNDFGYQLALVFPPRLGPAADFSPLDFENHVVQGARQVSGLTFQGMQNRTTATRARVLLDAPETTNDDESGALATWFAWPRGELVLHLPLLVDGEPCFWRSMTVLRSVVVLLPIDTAHHRLVALLTTCLGAARARVPLGGDLGEGSSLADTLAAFSDPLCDSDGDDQMDGWPIEVVAQMKAVEFADDPVRYEGAAISPTCN